MWNDIVNGNVVIYLNKFITSSCIYYERQHDHQCYSAVAVVIKFHEFTNAFETLVSAGIHLFVIILKIYDILMNFLFNFDHLVHDIVVKYNKL